METSEFIHTLEALHREAFRRGLYFQQCDSIEQFGRTLVIDGQPLRWFGSCSYLGLENHPEVLAQAHRALDEWGSQFSTSRGYLSVKPYAELEQLLCQVFDAHVVVGPTTTLAHMAAFDVLLTEKDAIVLDHQVHNSVYRAGMLARTRGTTVKTIRHEQLERSLDEVELLSRKHRHVWFSTDGVYSMYGDLAPFGLLRQLLDVAPNVRLYIDDAHGMSWAGRHGRGKFLASMGALSDRIVVATSLAKSFAACGGALVFSSEAECERVRRCGGTMLFSGPIQPATLGAAIAVARIHLSGEIVELQAALQERVMLFNRLLVNAGLPLLVENDTPIFFIRMGLPRVAFRVAEQLRADGMFVNLSMYPAVPMKRSGLRITLNNHLTFADIHQLVDSLAKHVPAALAAEGMSREDIDALFHGSVVGASARLRTGDRLSALIEASNPANSNRAPRRIGNAPAEGEPQELTLHTASTIGAMDADEWNRMLGASATCSWESLKMQEQLFQQQPRPEHNWDFHYGVVRDRSGAPICATFLTVAIGKDDMLMRHEVSKEVEARRVADPYYLTSLTVTFGSGLSEGNHLFIERSGPWRAALRVLIRWAMALSEQVGANQVVARDLPGDDEEVDRLFMSQGFVKVPMLDSHVLDVDWQDDDGLVARGPNNRARRQLRLLKDSADQFVRRVYLGGSGDAGKLNAEEIAQLHRLYLNVAERNYRINIFTLPDNMLQHMLTSSAWEVVTLSLVGDPHRPVAWFAAHRFERHYAALCCGLDYDAVGSHSCYRQMLYQIARRAKECGADVARLGMTADVEKRRFDSRVEKTCLYVSAASSYNSTILRDIVTDLGVAVTSSRPTP